MKKILFLLVLFLFPFSLAQEVDLPNDIDNSLVSETIQAGVKYNEATARLEAFRDVERKVKKDFLKEYLKDPNRKENFELMEAKKFIVKNKRVLCPFYIQDVIISYAIVYNEKPQYTFYYNPLGSLIRFDYTKDLNSYPTKTLGYSRYGNLVNVSFEVNENEQFVYDKNAKLISHWLDSDMKDSQKVFTKLLKVKRATFDFIENN